ncbi:MULTISPECIES: rhomboid family intramembrane serine protease [unclassified Rhodococcus (in: high G+C Gram-positive bacteria)]|uniref:rhomboid family intramembrane serine protease n=1 Tax=unclassified Rhodococcus (in: high G+C Gram-positive bacteria) TaxID=192944 RepID=UPI0007BC1DFE|nr:MULTISPECIES: rhomboid family intramembrane serine protease [unclassified Rhodococcus (in: high G+C Gram-positive bacteria)]KZF05220.1 rhomboid family intramembrane serine protease [Rhodococcus sp. EPR-147]KZF06054.1 rhomboid family intramembrane serine protease [Rhodococcus sp. EPR-279]
MSDISNRPAERARPVWMQAAILVGAFTVLLWVIEFIDVASGSRLERNGIQARSVEGLWGILFAPVLHDDWQHLIANTVPIVVLGFLVLLSGLTRGLAATGIIWVVGGFGTWLTAGSYTNTIGASILIFGFIAYLLVRGFFTRKLGQLAVGVVVFVLYGSALWGVLPSEPNVSWQGHLFGAVGGVVAARLLSADARAERARAKSLDRPTS